MLRSPYQACQWLQFKFCFWCRGNLPSDVLRLHDSQRMTCCNEDMSSEALFSICLIGERFVMVLRLCNFFEFHLNSTPNSRNRPHLPLGNSLQRQKRFPQNPLMTSFPILFQCELHTHHAQTFDVHLGPFSQSIQLSSDLH